MIIDANDKSIAPFIEVLDLDTGEFIRGVTLANFATSEYIQYTIDDGLTVQKIGNIVPVYTGKESYNA